MSNEKGVSPMEGRVAGNDQVHRVADAGVRPAPRRDRPLLVTLHPLIPIVKCPGRCATSARAVSERKSNTMHSTQTGWSRLDRAILATVHAAGEPIADRFCVLGEGRDTGGRRVLRAPTGAREAQVATEIAGDLICLFVGSVLVVAR